jgi:O-methyltransferase
VQRNFTLPGRLLRALLAARGATIVHLLDPKARRDLAIVRDTRKRTELLVEDVAAFEILAYVRAAQRLGGAMAELGVFAGGTARLICEAKGEAPLHLFDVFETLQQSAALPPEGSHTAEVRARFGSWHSPRVVVERLLAPYAGVRIHAGTFPDTARGLEHERFAFVHLDADIESSTRAGLQFFYPRMLAGGVIIGDDYNLPTVRRAFDDFFAPLPGAVIALPWGQAVAIKLAA